jgi:hypothetical protein
MDAVTLLDTGKRTVRRVLERARDRERKAG